MGARHHADRGALGRKARANREAVAERLGDGHDIGRNVLPFMGEQFAGAPHPALHLVIDEQQAELVGDRPQPLEIAVGCRAHAAFALDRLHEDRRRLLADRGPHLVQIAEGDMVEAFENRPKTFEVSLVSGRGEGREGAPVERAVAADDAVALGVPGCGLIFARDLDRQLARLGAGIAEEHGVGEGVVDEALGQPLLPRDPEQVRGVPQALGLLGHGLDDVRMAVAERGHRDAAGEIEKLAAVGGVEIEAFAPVDGNVPPTIGRHNG